MPFYNKIATHIGQIGAPESNRGEEIIPGGSYFKEETLGRSTAQGPTLRSATYSKKREINREIIPSVLVSFSLSLCLILIHIPSVHRPRSNESSESLSPPWKVSLLGMLEWQIPNEAMLNLPENPDSW